MMRKITKFGEVFFDYLAITILFFVSLILVIPAIPIYIGIIGYFEKDFDERDLKDIFKTIKNNYKIIIKFTLFQLLIVIIALLNIKILQENKTIIQMIVLGLSWIALFIFLVILIFAPIIIIKMNVNLKQLIYNSIILIFGDFFNTIILISIIVLYILIAFKLPIFNLISIYFITYGVHHLSLININKLKNNKEKKENS